MLQNVIEITDICHELQFVPHSIQATKKPPENSTGYDK
ncbi:hypothetical protein RINTU1_06640 [Candidatus Regiella insecticola]|uniref:Uncharacterized protein n=1 Tax=Candidatus Regiella insecticola TaxID=138073 RepID=A0A6L2ZMG7_9ENTR|nr:hypothetical protein RINTU1_06640 [Candidatus Regiella insecticola]